MTTENRQPQRNAFIFDGWWSGLTLGSLALAYELSPSVIHRSLIKESNARGLPRFSIVKSLRNAIGHTCLAPQNKAELRECVIRAYELSDD